MHKFIYLGILIFISCNSNKKTVEYEKIESSLETINKSATAEISGVWKLFKKSWYKGVEPSIVDPIFKDEYLEVKEQHVYETRKEIGKWYLTFSSLSDSLTKSNIIFNKVRKDIENSSGSAERVIELYYIKKYIDKGTTYLMLKSILTNELEIYVRQI